MLPLAIIIGENDGNRWMKLKLQCITSISGSIYGEKNCCGNIQLWILHTRNKIFFASLCHFVIVATDIQTLHILFNVLHNVLSVLHITYSILYNVLIVTHFLQGITHFI